MEQRHLSGNVASSRKVPAVNKTGEPKKVPATKVAPAKKTEALGVKPRRSSTSV
jgi:hypothetical protein